jgi:hypothetical protein
LESAPRSLEEGDRLGFSTVGKNSFAYSPDVFLDDREVTNDSTREFLRA